MSNIKHLTETVVWFNAYDPSSTSFVYDGTGATAATTGQEPTPYYKKKTIFISVATLNSTTLTVQIEGMPREFDGSYTGQAATWFVLFRHTFTAAGTQVIALEHPVTYLRVGVKVAGNSSGDSVTVCGDFC